MRGSAHTPNCPSSQIFSEASNHLRRNIWFYKSGYLYSSCRFGLIPTGKSPSTPPSPTHHEMDVSLPFLRRPGGLNADEGTQPFDSGVLEKRWIHKLQDDCSRVLDLGPPGSHKAWIHLDQNVQAPFRVLLLEMSSGPGGGPSLNDVQGEPP
ncbi:hypothetical protein XENOCAPTIV_015772 [Xenoophorus captivus]|uniref:Uncharacterized protein n=1 Tax=Xenoophorus captivus TaxID=1517983 RepID=A0ABV0QS23_9TELE